MAPVVRDCDHSEKLRRLEVDEVIRKAVDRGAANIQLFGNARNWRPRSWNLAAPVDGVVDLGEEPMAKTGGPGLIPAGRLFGLSACRILEAERLGQGFFSWSSRRSRTSCQETPTASPDRTRRARRSISAAHAVSTSACGSLASSRLAKSSAATSARSSGGSYMASRKMLWACAVMGETVAPGRLTLNALAFGSLVA